MSEAYWTRQRNRSSLCLSSSSAFLRRVTGHAFGSGLDVDEWVVGLVGGGDADGVRAGGDGSVSETQRFLGLLALGNILVGDHGTRVPIGWKAGHPSNEPTPFGRRMARIL